jgi:hypothetical protein
MPFFFFLTETRNSFCVAANSILCPLYNSRGFIQGHTTLYRLVQCLMVQLPFVARSVEHCFGVWNFLFCSYTSWYLLLIFAHYTAVIWSYTGWYLLIRWQIFTRRRYLLLRRLVFVHYTNRYLLLYKISYSCFFIYFLLYTFD